MLIQKLFDIRPHLREYIDAICTDYERNVLDKRSQQEPNYTALTALLIYGGPVKIIDPHQSTSSQYTITQESGV